MIIKYKDLILLSVLSSKAIFMVDRSFILLKSTFILAIGFMVQKGMIIDYRNFISSVYEQYRHPYTAELYRVLSIITMLDIILSAYLYPSTLIKIEIGYRLS